MKAYDSLSTFPDVPPALKAIYKEEDIFPVVFSNGTNSMVTNSINTSPDLAPYASVLQDTITVEDVKCFKPAPAVYYHLADTIGIFGRSKEDMARIWMVSGNPFDVVGARSVGMHAVWVDRAGSGWTDRLVEGEAGRPTVIVKGLEEVVQEVRKFSKGNQ